MSEQDATLDEFTQEENNSQEGSDKSVAVGELQQLEQSPIASWSLVKLGDILTLEYGDNLPSDSREDGEVPVYGSNGQVDTHIEVAVNRPGIILGRKGSIGEIEFSDKPFWPIDTTYYITDKETDQNLRFLYYLLQNIQLERLNAASAIPGLNRNDTYGLNSLTPPIKEQRKIASVLYTVDQAIQKTEELINKVERVKTGLKQDILCQGLEPTEMQPVRIVSQQVTVSQEWEMVPLSEISKSGKKTFTDGDWVESDDMVEDGKYQLIQLGNLGEGEFKGTCDRYVDEEFFQDENCTLVEPGDLLIARMADPILRTIIVPEFERQSITVVDIVVAKVDETEWDRRYIKYLLNTKTWENIAEALASGSTRKRISRENMSRILIPKPPIDEQREIADVIESVEARRDQEITILDQLKRLKRGLMQDLLSGQVRTHHKDIEVVNDVLQHG